jgi:asparagine synthase (glutamine-hydrolysing)
MRLLQRHRGPDDDGVRFFSLRRGTSTGFRRGEPAHDRDAHEGAVGFNRLSIQDLSANGHQPMVNDDGSVFIAFAGEIYNAPELRPALESAGYNFRGHSDTEVLLHLYERYGAPEMFDHVNGMFALCIVDLRRRRIVLARDRLGIKPLYVADLGDTVLFGTEAKSFLAWPGFPLELDEERVDECLLFRFCADDGHPLRHVHAVRPGHYRVIEGGESVERPYWQIPHGESACALSFEEALEQVGTTLERSVQRHLLSDVKVGCQLSGGIDSSLITVLSRRYFDADLETFSIVPEDPRFSEDRWISEAASAARADSHRFPLRAEYVIEHLGDASWHLDQPLNIPNSVAIYYLAARSKPSVTVLLSGEGADELFGGYNRFYHAAARHAPLPWRKRLRRIIRPKRNARYAGAHKSDPAAWFVGLQAFLTADRLREIRPAADPEAVAAGRRAIFSEGKGDFLHNCLRYELRTWLVDLLLRQEKMTLAHSVENRVPMLDHELVQLVRSMPIDYLVRTASRRGARVHGTKRILKELAARYFGDDFVYRRKVGFALPLGTYYSHPKFIELMEDRILPGMRRRGLVRADVVERWWRTSDEDPKARRRPIWSAVAFELWAGEFLDGNWRHRLNGCG